jgi:glycerol uptake facilitator-like aquaporin
MKISQRIVAEFIGTTFLLIIVVGSGIMGQNLSKGYEAITLLANSIATGAGLFVLIKCLGPISGAHFNPVVSLVELLWERLSKEDLFSYWMAQISGAVFGVFITHVMFNLPLLQIAEKHREGFHLAFSEFIATFGLISVISLVGRKHVEWAPMTIATYITSAYWFTSSTSFTNPAVTLARSLTNTFCGINPAGIVWFVVAQLIGSVVAFLLLRKLEV